jgi:hypothetical protein
LVRSSDFSDRTTHGRQLLMANISVPSENQARTDRLTYLLSKGVPYDVIQTNNLLSDKPNPLFSQSHNPQSYGTFNPFSLYPPVNPWATSQTPSQQQQQDPVTSPWSSAEPVETPRKPAIRHVQEPREELRQEAGQDPTPAKGVRIVIPAADEEEEDETPDPVLERAKMQNEVVTLLVGLLSVVLAVWILIQLVVKRQEWLTQDMSLTVSALVTLDLTLGLLAYALISTGIRRLSRRL